MITPLPALAAYRKDVALLIGSAPQGSELDDRLTRWLAYAATVESLAESWNAEHEAEVSRALDSLLRDLGADSTDSRPHARDASAEAKPLHLRELAALTRRLADEAEQGGALWLANSMLATVEKIGDGLPPLETGRILALRARVAR